MKNIEVVNKKSYFDYFVEDKYEVGIVLQGKEVKAIRNRRFNLTGAWCIIKDNEIFIEGMHISPYQDSNAVNSLVSLDPYRLRKLLLHKQEIRKLQQKVKIAGYTLIPLKLYFVDNKVKLEIGVCKGKHNYDKREVLKKKDIERNDMRNIG